MKHSNSLINLIIISLYTVQCARSNTITNMLQQLIRLPYTKLSNYPSFTCVQMRTSIAITTPLDGETVSKDKHQSLLSQMRQNEKLRCHQREYFIIVDSKVLCRYRLGKYEFNLIFRCVWLGQSFLNPLHHRSFFCCCCW